MGSRGAHSGGVGHGDLQLGLLRRQIDAALDYYADFTAEIDEEIAMNVAAADELEAAWRRRQGLLAG